MDLAVGASSDAVKSLVGKLGSLLAQQYGLIQGVRDDIRYINDEMASMQAFLTAIERAGNHDEQRRVWMKQVRDMVYDIEDVNHRLGPEPRGNDKLMFIRKAWYLLTTLNARRCVATEIGNLKVWAQDISNRRMRYGVENPTTKDGCSEAEETEDPSSDHVAPPPQFVVRERPVGLDSTVEKLEVLLEYQDSPGCDLESRTNYNNRTLAIFGIGGLGKSRLARELYDKYGDKFHHRAFVQVSKKFNLVMLLRSLVEQFHRQQTHTSPADLLDRFEEWGEIQLKKKLAAQLKDKREVRRSPLFYTLDHHLSSVAMSLRGVMGTNLTKNLLSQCYNDLPADLKTCLLYLTMFPKGCLISRKRLIRRWIAEGFIIEKDGLSVEVVAEDCFNELVGRNFIQPIKVTSTGKVKDCQVSDMVLEYIVSKSGDENFITIVGGLWQTIAPDVLATMYRVRCLSVHGSGLEEQEIVERMDLSHVRSFTAFEGFKALQSCLARFQVIQVMDLANCGDLSSRQLKKICKLHQLKYLSLRGTGIEEIPSEIGKLEYLELLDIRDTKVRVLPQSVKRLKRMAHLLTGDKSKRIALTATEEITDMIALQTLSRIEISGRSTAAIVGSSMIVAGALQNLTQLKKLNIYLVGRFEETDVESLLSAIEHLSCCSLKFLAIYDDFTGFLDSSLGFSVAPPEHLQSLELSGMLSKLPNWIRCLFNLEKLTLSLTTLRTETLVILSKLPLLFSLTFSLDATKWENPDVVRLVHMNISDSEGEIFVEAGGFGKLKLLQFIAPVLPPLSFLEGAMPAVQMLELRFASTMDGVQGLENLVSLRQVFLAVSSKAPWAATQIKQIANRVSNSPTVIVHAYNE
ncbi:hypothetical protein VPH35_069229 [Triticum aestivum]